MNINKKILKQSDIVSLKARELYSQYGYKQYRMQKFEELSLYLENKDFLESSSLISFNDLDGKLLALKPDVTLSIVKNTLDDIVDVERLFYLESVYRVSKQSKKYCEIKQMGLEAIGDDVDGPVIAEVIELALVTLNEVDSNFVLDLSHLGFIEGLLMLFGPGYATAIRECLISKNTSEMRAFLQSKKIVSNELIDDVIKIIELSGDCKKVLSESRKLAKNVVMEKAVDELEQIVKAFEGTPYENNLRIDYSIVNNTKYYKGIVFQGFVPNIPQVLLLGGCYGNIFRNFDQYYDAIGFAINLDLLDTYYPASKSEGVDILLEYGKKDPKEVLEKARELRSKGKSVVAIREDFGSIKYKSKVDFTK